VVTNLDSAAFPDDAASLRALLAERDAAIAERDAALVERDAALTERDAHLLNARLEIEKLKAQLAALRRDRYGKSSERLAAEIGQLEMLIGDLEEDQAEREAAAAEKQRRAKGKSGDQRKPALRRPLPAHLPRETVRHEPVPACRCGCTESGASAPFPWRLDAQLVFVGAQCQGMSSSMRLCGQPLTSRVSRSVR
jgi:transposase